MIRRCVDVGCSVNQQDGDPDVGCGGHWADVVDGKRALLFRDAKCLGDDPGGEEGRRPLGCHGPQI